MGIKEVMVIPEVGANSSWIQNDHNLPISINLVLSICCLTENSDGIVTGMWSYPFVPGSPIGKDQNTKLPRSLNRY